MNEYHVEHCSADKTGHMVPEHWVIKDINNIAVAVCYDELKANLVAMSLNYADKAVNSKSS